MDEGGLIQLRHGVATAFLVATACVVAGATSAASPSAVLSLGDDTHHLQPLVASRLGVGPTRPFRDTAPRTPAPHFSPASHYSRFLSVVFPPGYWGGTYTASNGENVTVAVSEYYFQDPAGPQSYAEFFATGLIHGPELAQLAVVVVEPLSAVQQDCGGDALACYYPSDQLMFVPGEDPQAGVPLESIVAHEYGHHVANHSVNTPWAAVDWGAKRWASYENICTRTLQRTAYPGDEGEHYTLNPGEAFADTYRVMNELRWGLSPSSIYWPVVDQSFFPDARAIQTVNQDVTAPWTANATTGTSGRFLKNGTRLRAYPLKTPLDGLLGVGVRSTAGRYTVSLVDAGRQVASGRRFSRTICGGRSAALVVHRKGQPGRFSLNVSRP